MIARSKKRSRIMSMKVFARALAAGAVEDMILDLLKKTVLRFAEVGHVLVATMRCRRGTVRRAILPTYFDVCPLILISYRSSPISHKVCRM